MTHYKRILVTGGCGFIGSSLVTRILDDRRATSIVILDNYSTGAPEDLAEVTSYMTSSPSHCSAREGVILVEGDIRDPETTLYCAQGADCIVHLAANTGVAPSVDNPRLDLECNVVGTFNMLESARVHGVKKFIFASSGAPAGECEPPIHEEVPLHPVSPYGASKLAGEGYCSAYYRTFGLGTVCLRFGNVYGPRSKKKSSVVAKFIRQAVSGEPCVVYGDGTQTRDFIYIDDLLRAILLSMDRELSGEVFQIAAGMERTVGEVAHIISNLLIRRGIKMKINHDRPRLGDVKRNYADTRKADRMLGWRAQVSIEQGIEVTIDYFLNNPPGRNTITTNHG